MKHPWPVSHSLSFVKDGHSSVAPLDDINNDGYADMQEVQAIVYRDKDRNFRTAELKLID